MWKRLRSAIAYIFVIGFIFSFGYASNEIVGFYATASRTPDASTGRTFPFQLHGIVYVQPHQGEQIYGLLLVAALCFIAAIITHPRIWEAE
jgi:hypothetical protein